MGDLSRQQQAAMRVWIAFVLATMVECRCELLPSQDLGSVVGRDESEPRETA